MELTVRFHLQECKSMYVQYKVNVFEYQVDTLKDAIRLNKAVTLCFQR